MNQEITITENVSEIREKSKKRKRNKGFLIGVIINILAIIGVVAIIVITIFTIKNMFTQDLEKQKWADYLFPIVMVNPPEFETVNDITEEEIRLISVWATLINTDLSTLDRHQETDYYMIPESEVSKQAASLFGKDYPYTHSSVDAPDISYEYDETEKAYLIRDYDKDVNTPYIYSIDKTEAGLQIAVGYLPPAAPWELNPDGSRKTNTAEKYMYFIIDNSEKEPRVISLEPAHELNELLLEQPSMNTGQPDINIEPGDE